eukprot:CAMPEP_0184390588 /NCGR_PEP_ID=MMETSP0007-20130409/13429_1 /TAXON_ID=97485 /ORGANISM="Prymnesium parvum, Strain Texoma1" /LENGTH=101 /DNA_ID=CAMNT_0026740389 /DNA_START=24 /DNA_END=330 /DNA_ORIENTATION=-
MRVRADLPHPASPLDFGKGHGGVIQGTPVRMTHEWAGRTLVPRVKEFCLARVLHASSSLESRDLQAMAGWTMDRTCIVECLFPGHAKEARPVLNAAKDSLD